MTTAFTVDELYRRAYGRALEPFPYQRAYAERGDDIDVLIAPTGLGKTAAVTLGWTWRRLHRPDSTPRRLVWCLPMRTLVEQTAKLASGWMANLTGAFASVAQPVPAVCTLMGATVESDWRLAPENPAILVGTQDMLLSRALMRGYGMSRFGWPIDFGLLHTDALWVFDEVQLMGAGLATSTQLEGFRRHWFGLGRLPVAERHRQPPVARSLWVSATLEPAWLTSAELKDQLTVQRYDDGKPPEPLLLATRLDAIKHLRRAATVLTADTANKAAARYAEPLAREVAVAHKSGTTTLVILNTVRRAQALDAALARTVPDITRLLIHSRFRAADRAMLTARLADEAGSGRIIVATQAVEAGIDLTSATLFTELAPWSSLIQRFGRCNREGECNQQGGADIVWIDLDLHGGDGAARPYDVDALTAARVILDDRVDVSPRALPPPSEPAAPYQVIRPKDFAELFNTDADLSGYDLDISIYIRDGDDMAVNLFWRDLQDRDPGLEAPPVRAELCPAPIDQVKEWLRNSGEGVFVENPNARRQAGKTENIPRWIPLGRNGRLRPGMTLMVDAAVGGYRQTTGFDPASKVAVNPCGDIAAVAHAETAPGAETDEDPRSAQRQVPLVEHLRDVAAEVRRIAQATRLGAADVDMLAEAGAWHDVGKSHDEFRRRLRVPEGEPPLAKSLEYDRSQSTRPFFRHELASALAFAQQHDGSATADLVAFLIAAHHGKVRLGLRALPDEKGDPPEARIARGVQHGDVLPEVDWGTGKSAAVTLSLTPMDMGEDADGRPSWAARSEALLATHGPFRLAYLEALLRMADWRASDREQALGEDSEGSDG